jgi:AraC-like DNA-binding protein
VERGIAEALRGIHEQLERPRTVQQLSTVARMSRSTFIRRFGATMGTSPMAYLVETTAPLITVARRSGYATPFAFTYAFRRKYGVPPGRYRVDRSTR